MKLVIILDSARKHGVDDTDIEFVYEFAVSSMVLNEDPTKVMLFGFDTIGRGLEVGILITDQGEDIVMHAMKIRQNYKKYLYDRRR